MFKFIHGNIQAGKLVAYCVAYNEMYYLPAFLEHYRALGIEQFVFIDDHSTDDSVDFLSAQPDTVVLRPSMRFGDKLNGKRAGPQWRSIFALQYLQGQWALCLDADEFLVSKTKSLKNLIAQADARGDVALGAVMVDMYPRLVKNLKNPERPQSFADMLELYSCFDQGPYIEWRTGALRPQVRYEGAGGRLLSQRGIKASDYSSILIRLREYFRTKRVRSVFKVPLVKWRAGLHYVDSHTLNLAPAPQDGLALLHFKYTSALQQKISWAKERKSFSKASRGYFAMDEMLSSVNDVGNGFTYEGTLQYASYGDLEAARIVPFHAP